MLFLDSLNDETKKAPLRRTRTRKANSSTAPAEATRKINQKQKNNQKTSPGANATPTRMTRKTNSAKTTRKVNQTQKNNQEISPDSLLSDVETASPATYVLSDDEAIDQNQQNNSSVVSLPTEPSIQDPEETQQQTTRYPEEARQQIRDISIEVDLHSKQPTQFHNMSNEFEIAYWLAHHKRILDLAINIRDGMANGINKESDMASTSTYALTHRLSYESVSTPPEIDQVIKTMLIFS